MKMGWLGKKVILANEFLTRGKEAKDAKMQREVAK